MKAKHKNAAALSFILLASCYTYLAEAAVMPQGIQTSIDKTIVNTRGLTECHRSNSKTTSIALNKSNNNNEIFSKDNRH